MNRCRIINGKLGRRFVSVPGTTSTRPTSDIVKQAIFNVLLHRFQFDFSNAFVVDLFAGSGSLGLEAISCGCTNALFIDSNKQAFNCIQENIEYLKVRQFATVINNQVDKISDSLFLNLAERFNQVLVFMDPPYAEKILLNNQIRRFVKLFTAKNLFIVVESDEVLSIEGLSNEIITKHGGTVVVAIQT